ncbi:MAG: hypothetical protein BA863_00765 [Desulfovibrio sp. S3730MH75]|nr:MAG: hypothetical protein BA863_00765 [Desulfovibrio sp. S3730MH75]
MGKLEWIDSLSVGVESIDDEHKKLIKIANSIIKMSRDFSDTDQFTRAMSYLREYTVLHFSNEEAYMVSINYPDLTKHSAEHARLKRIVKEFQSKIYHKEEIESDEVLEFMKGWLVAHVLGSDMKIKEYIEEQKAKAISEKKGKAIIGNSSVKSFS